MFPKPEAELCLRILGWPPLGSKNDRQHGLANAIRSTEKRPSCSDSGKLRSARLRVEFAQVRKNFVRQSTSRQIGAAIGTALLGATLVAGLGSVTGELTDRGVPLQQAEAVTELMRTTAGTAVTGLADQPGGEALAEGASAGFASATSLVGFVAATLIGLGFLAALRLPADAARTEAAGYGPAHGEAPTG